MFFWLRQRLARRFFCRLNLYLIHKKATIVFDLNYFFKYRQPGDRCSLYGNLRKGLSLSVNGVFHYITGIIIHPKWTKSRDEFDIALVCFKNAGQGDAPSRIYRETWFHSHSSWTARPKHPGLAYRKSFLDVSKAQHVYKVNGLTFHFYYSSQLWYKTYNDHLWVTLDWRASWKKWVDWSRI